MNVSLWSSWRGCSSIAVLMVVFGAGLPSRVAAQSAATPAGQPPTVEAMLTELRKLVIEQRALIDGQAERIGALESRLAALVPPVAGAPAAPAVVAPAATVQEVHRQPEMPKEVVSAGDFPGSIPIPGTDSAIKFGGQAGMTLVHTLGPLGTSCRPIAGSLVRRGRPSPIPKPSPSASTSRG